MVGSFKEPEKKAKFRLIALDDAIDDDDDIYNYYLITQVIF